jgi:hypothetical protein
LTCTRSTSGARRIRPLRHGQRGHSTRKEHRYGTGHLVLVLVVFYGSYDVFCGVVAHLNVIGERLPEAGVRDRGRIEAFHDGPDVIGSDRLRPVFALLVVEREPAR